MAISPEWYRGQMVRYIICLNVAALIAFSGPVRAQTSLNAGAGMEIRGAGGLKPPTIAPPLTGADAGIKRHLGPTGRPCLTVSGDAKPERINPKIFEHTVLARNECSQRIKMKICYYQSEHCVETEVAPYGRNEVMLGIMPSMNSFRFEFREEFNPF
jgi:hypothetical protein